jgi:hypothetical protein
LSICLRRRASEVADVVVTVIAGYSVGCGARPSGCWEEVLALPSARRDISSNFEASADNSDFSHVDESVPDGLLELLEELTVPTEEEQCRTLSTLEIYGCLSKGDKVAVLLSQEYKN